MRLALLILCFLLPTAAHADPVTAAVAAFAAWAGTTAVVVYLTATAIALSIGTAVYGTAQARKAERQARDASYAAMRDRMVNRIATEAPHRFIYGRAKVGASIVAMFTSGDKDQYRHLVCVHANHECDGIEAVYVNNVLVAGINANGDATAGRYSVNSNSGVEEESKTGPSFTLAYQPLASSVHAYSGSGATITPVTVTSVSGFNVTVAYTGPVTVVYDRSVGRLFSDAIAAALIPSTTPLVRVKTHLGGASDPVDAYLNSVLPAKWPATAVLRGMCYTVVTLDLNNPEFQNGQVPIHAIIRGKKLYDPRTGLTAWSQNPVLAIRDYLTSPLCDVPAADLPAAQFITAANVCDEVIDGAPRYTLNGDITSDQGQANILEKMAQSMAGGIVSTTWDIFAGKYIAPVLALDQSDIVGSTKITPGPSDSVIYNGVKGQYISAENNYVLTDFKPYQNAAYRAYDASDLYTNIDFPFSDSLQRVTNLARIFTEDMRNGFTLSAEFSLKAWPIKVGQRVTFTSAFLGQTAKVYRVTDKSFSPSSAVQLTLKEDDASIWDFADAVTVDSTPNTNLPDPFAIEPLASLTLSAGEATLLRQSDGTTIPRMLVTWPLAPTLAVQDNGQIEIEWRAIGSTVWSKTSIPGSATQAYLSPITPGWAYVVRACCANPYIGTKSNWISAQYQVIVYSAQPVVYMWSASQPATPTGTSSYTWGSGAYAAPSGWSLTVPAAPGGNQSLWEARALVTDISNSGSTLFYWAIASVGAVGYSPAPVYSNARVYAYQRSASAPSGTPGDVTVTFASNSITAPAALANGWVRDIPTTNGNPLYVTAISGAGTGATVNLLSSGWSGAAVLATDGPGGTGTNGTNGLNSATITIYQRSASATALTLPSAATTYTFATGVVAGLDNGWVQGVPAADATKPFLQVSLATAVSASATDTVLASEWSATQVLVQDGTTGGLLSDDPYILNAPGAWTVPSGITVLTGTTATGAVCSNHFDAANYSTSADCVVLSRRAFPIDPTRTYDLSANIYVGAGNNRNMYVLVNFYDASGSPIASNGWGGTYSGYVYGSAPPFTGGFARYGGLFGVGGPSRPIPSNARTAKIGVWFQYSGGGSSSVEQAAQDIRLRDVTEAAAAQAAADTANAAIANIASDNVLSAGEKPEVALKWNAIYAEATGFIAQADAMSVSRTAYAAAYDALVAYLNPIPYTTYTTDTVIVGSTFRTKFGDYYNAKAALLVALHDKNRAAASAAQADATSANAAIANISDDNVLSKGEKPEVTLKWNAIYAEASGLIAQADALTVSRTAYAAAYDALVAYLNPIPYTTYTTDTAIVGSTFRTKFGDYYAAKQALINAMAAKSATLSTWDGTSGPNKPADNATVGAPAGTYVGSTPATTVEANAANALANAATANANLAPVIAAYTIAGLSGVTNSGANGVARTFSKTASLTGGVAPFTYLWTETTGAGVTISNTSTATCTVRAQGFNEIQAGTLNVIATDSNGRSVSTSCNFSMTFGTP